VGFLSRWAIRRPVVAVISWFVAIALAGVVGTQLGGELNDSFELPDTESTTAQEYLGQLQNNGEATGSNVRIV